MGKLGPDPMELKGGKETDHSMGNPLCRLNQALMLRGRMARKGIEPPTLAMKDPFLFESAQDGSRKSIDFHISRPEHP